jgi:hypothetical protein
MLPVESSIVADIHGVNAIDHRRLQPPACCRRVAWDKALAT